MVKWCTSEFHFDEMGAYGARKYWFSILVEANGAEFIIPLKPHGLLQKVDRTKVKFHT